MKILLIGDSHTVGKYGENLQKLYMAAGFDVVLSIAHVGAKASDYTEGKYRKEIVGIQSQKFDVVVITLGTNDAAMGAPYDKTAKAIVDLYQEFDKTGAKTFYVGPPAFSENAAKTYNKAFKNEDLNARSQKLIEKIQPSIPSTYFIDPRNATAAYAQKKDIHFGPNGGKAWATFVFNQIAPSVQFNKIEEVPPPLDKPVASNYGIALVLALTAAVAIKKFRSFRPEPVAAVGQLSPGLIQKILETERMYGSDPNVRDALTKLPPEITNNFVNYLIGGGIPLGALPRKGRVKMDTAKRALKNLPRHSQNCPGMTASALREGMEIEREHRDLTKGRVGQTAKIAAAHICERPDYYRRVKRYLEN